MAVFQLGRHGLCEADRREEAAEFAAEEEKDNGPPGWEVEILAGGFRLTQQDGGDGASGNLAMPQRTFDAVCLWWVWRGRFSQTGS